MHILVDADACPVRAILVEEARLRGLPVTMVFDNSHIIEDGYSRCITVDRGADSADWKIANLVTAGDLVVTQDYGVAALALGKGARALSQNGLVYTADNIDRLLFERFLGGRVRRAGGRTRGPKKRTAREDEAFRAALIALLDAAQRAAPPLSGNPSGKDTQPD